jgi:hypothetical protein
MATKVVMLTAMAGAGLDLSYGDVYETDEVEAARFLEHNAAREFDEKEDANKPVKRKQDSEAIPEGHFQNDKPKGKKKRTGQNSGDQESTEVTGESTSTSGSTDGSTGEESSAAGELADGSELSAEIEPANAGPEDKPAPAPAPRARPRR